MEGCVSVRQQGQAKTGLESNAAQGFPLVVYIKKAVIHLTVVQAEN